MGQQTAASSCDSPVDGQPPPDSSAPPLSSTGSSGDGSDGSSSDSPPPPPLPPPNPPAPTQTSTLKQFIPKVYPQVLVLPTARRPPLPGFYKAVIVRNPAVVAAIREMMRRDQPYLGAFLLKDEHADSDVITDINSVHEVGVFAQITGVIAANTEPTAKDGDGEEGLTAVFQGRQNSSQIKYYCRESGVRNLKKHIYKICRKPVAAVQDEKTEDPQKTVEKQDAPSNEPAAKETSVPKQGGKKGERKVTTAERGHCSVILILFNIIPTFVDIFVALIFFCVYCEWTLALVIFLVMTAYIAASIILTRWRTQLRRQMNERDAVTRGIHTDCLLNYETVKYFGGEQHEGERYQDAIRQHQSVGYKVLVSLSQHVELGAKRYHRLLVGSMLVALRVTRGRSQPHQFVLFITYLAQVNQSLVDTEKLLNEPAEVNDKPGASDLTVEDGEIEFDDVTFSYDGRTTALNGVSFKVPKRSSVALVGESGSGKSTILRLLYRFYNIKDGEGRILIYARDIRDVTQASLRKAIGVVPQGRYYSMLASDITSAQAAQMHERILSFPDGYGTKVGERGIRLSGGEKQRVAVARTLLKNPLFYSWTKRHDNRICRRTLVLKDGQIAEQGSHTELLAKGGFFASMWAGQISSAEGCEDRSVETPEIQPAEIPFNNDTFGFPASDEPDPTAFPTADASAPVFPPSDNNEAPVSLPSSDSPAPIAFPDSQVEQDGKRRRTLSTQGIQRLARRMSVTGLYPDRVFSKPEFTALSLYLFSGADFALIPSRDEPFGLVAVEFDRKGALGVGSRLEGLGLMPGWWFPVESMSTEYMMSQSTKTIKMALKSEQCLAPDLLCSVSQP
ncbi:hypothetical protein EW026_g7493 [Hermanssonia centrifuga]|uniref:Uncharacterized protein n=1 Tax=Hermanssonia centrifuga TaxID=98765 RepID=A0A4S4K7N1_9APHY|nr:hypothetical protein EW026_g7493 [Hermanssonia centrifuga]